MWAMMQKFRIRAGSVDAGVVTVCPSSHGLRAGTAIARDGGVAHGPGVSLPGSPRLPYARLPARCGGRSKQCFAPLHDVRPCVGGFSPGTAAVLTGVDGSRVFVKAAGTPLNPDTPELHRTETRIAAQLPASLPTPVLRWSGELQDGDDVWVALVFDAVDGAAPTLPWSGSAAVTVLETLTRLAALATPCPVTEVPSVVERMGPQLSSWAGLAADPPADLHPWERAHLDWLADVPSRLAGGGWLDGDTLVHNDLRADNLLLGPDGVVVVDWPWAARGADWIDSALFALDPAVHGDVDPEDLVARSPLVAAADPAEVTDLVLGLAGMWADRMRRPAPRGLPTLRPFQRRFHDAALTWGARRVAAGLC